MDYKIVEVKENILIENEQKAKQLREKLSNKNIYFINVMASPGSGKTTLLVNLINRLKNKYSFAVMEADIDGDVDADRISKLTGVPAIQVHTGGTCHLTAQMVEDAIDSFNVKDIDVLVLENVGNLVCPAEFDTGAHLNLVLLSIPEGDDKPLKYPLMFEVANLVAITKIDTLPAFNFDFNKCQDNIRLRNKKADVYFISALKNQGIDELEEALDKRISSSLQK